jgi:hypothetical protein
MISNGDVRRHLDFQNEDRKGNHEMSGAWDSAMELILKELEQGFHFPYSLRHDVHTPSRNDKRGFCVNDRILFDSCFEVVLCRCLSGTSLTRKFSIPIDFQSLFCSLEKIARNFFNVFNVSATKKLKQEVGHFTQPIIGKLRGEPGLHSHNAPKPRRVQDVCVPG